MNLIEQLGGYEKAKRELELKEKDSVLQCCIAVTAEMIRDALLEYRRQNNIFEVGDYVFHPMFGALFEIKRIAEKYVVASTKSGYETNLLIELISHANDAEIKAGNRL